MNEVDVLLERVKSIQTDCSHSFQKIKDCGVIKESLVKGVILGGPGHVFSFIVRCISCSLELQHNACFICPNCFLPLVKDSFLSDRQQYFGRAYLYYAVRIAHCPQCEFAVANDEWDQ